MVFDCDGLLLDTREAWHTAYAAVLAADGRSLDEKTISALNGASIAGAARVLGVPSDALRQELEVALADHASSMPGAEALLSALGTRFRLAVATNGPAAAARRGLEGAGLLHHFDAVVSAEEVGSDKPAPDVYLAACEVLKVDPSDAIALEDSVVGAEAARAAGLVVIYVPSDASQRASADLRVPRLDDPMLLELLRVDYEASLNADGRLRPWRQLERVCRLILDDEAISTADPEAVTELAGSLHRDLLFWRRAQRNSVNQGL
jgi:HAD superfamily hydrolase (TIGR01509 family)